MITAVDEALEKLLASPRLPLYARKIGDVLAREAMQRQRFYEQSNDSDKAEFINGEVIFQRSRILTSAAVLFTDRLRHFRTWERPPLSFFKLVVPRPSLREPPESSS